MKVYPRLGMIAAAVLGSLLLRAGEPTQPAPAAVTAPAAPAAEKSTNPAPAAATPDVTKPTGGPREYEVEELSPIMNQALRGNRSYANGEKIFEQVGCNLCHSLGGSTGGIGPDLTGVGGRYGVSQIIDSILNPNTVVSDLYDKKRVIKTDGTEIVGKLMGQGDEITLALAYTVDPGTGTAYWPTENAIKIKSDDVESMEDALESVMPPGMINGLKEIEVADLLAFLMSGGNTGSSFFKPYPAPAAAK